MQLQRIGAHDFSVVRHIEDIYPDYKTGDSYVGLSSRAAGRVLKQSAYACPAVVLQQTYTRNVEVGVARHGPVEVRILLPIAQYWIRVAV